MFCDLIIIWTLFVLLKGLFLITFEVEGNPKTMMAKYGIFSMIIIHKNPQEEIGNIK